MSRKISILFDTSALTMNHSLAFLDTHAKHAGRKPCLRKPFFNTGVSLRQKKNNRKEFLKASEQKNLSSIYLRAFEIGRSFVSIG